MKFFFQWFILWLLVTFLLLFGSIECGITSQWKKCGCRWMEWEAWGTCDSECNGFRSRSRKVWLYTHMKGCVFDFNTCATDDMGWDHSRCNTFCYNGGTSNSYYCSCVTGFHGHCCGLRKNLIKLYVLSQFLFYNFFNLYMSNPFLYIVKKKRK